MPLVLEPDFETIAVAWLKASAEVIAVVPVAAIATKLRRPWEPGDVALRIRRLGGLPTEGATEHLKRGRLQVECFAGDEDTAALGARLAMARLRELAGTTDGDVVVTEVRTDLGLSNVPDPDSSAERFLGGVVLYGHAAPG